MKRCISCRARVRIKVHYGHQVQVLKHGAPERRVEIVRRMLVCPNGCRVVVRAPRQPADQTILAYFRGTSP